MARTHFNKRTSRQDNTETWGTIADTRADAETIAATLRRKGFAVVVETWDDADGNFLWFNVTGKRQWRTDTEAAASRAELLKAPCGDGCGLVY